MTEHELDFRNDRDATLKLIDWFDIERVREAKVLVVGAGAIGNEVLKNLALLGVGHIYIFDRDTVEMANLSRSILYRAKDNGQPKAPTAAAAVLEINPAVNVYWHAGDIESDLGEGLIRRMNVVIGCLDSVDARYLLNRRCMRAGIPWVDAGIGTLNGHVRVYQPPNGACYECLFTEAQYGQLSCNALAAANIREGRVPTTPTIASLVAAVQVQECLKLLDPERWVDRSLVGRQLDYLGDRAAVQIVGLPRRHDCDAHDGISIDALVELAHLTAGHSAGELLAAAVEVLGHTAHLYLENTLGLERRCPDCGDVLSIFKPINKVYREDLTCACGRECRWDSDITKDHIIRSSSPPGLLSTSLRQIGVPAFGVVTARGIRGLSYLELTGDAQGVVETLRPEFVVQGGGL